MQQYRHDSSLMALGTNLAGLADAAAMSAVAVGNGGFAVVQRLFAVVRAPSQAHDCGCNSCGCHMVRHHYCCDYIPPRYDCGCGCGC